MTTYTGQREQDLARRVRRMLIEQSAVLQDENPDEFTWLTKNFVNEQRFFDDELGARLELRQGRWARAYWPTAPRSRELCISDIFELTARKQTAYACLIRAYRSVRLLEGCRDKAPFNSSGVFRGLFCIGRMRAGGRRQDQGGSLGPRAARSILRLPWLEPSWATAR